MRQILIGIVLLAGLLSASCSGGSGTPDATFGTISGSVTVAGPINGAANLQVGLFPSGSDDPALTAEAGHITSAAAGTAALSGRAITYSFTEVPFGTYNVGLFYAAGGSNVFLYRGSDIALNAQHASVTGQTATASFTGSGPFGSVSGATLIGGDWPTDGQLVFVGLAPQSNPSAALQLIVSEDELNEGVLHYGLESIAYGTYFVGLFGYNPVTHAVTTFGQFDAPVVVSAAQPNAANVNFGSDFAGDPGVDPELGSIAGTITFSGTLSDSLYVYVAANTIPPQQGPPPAVFDVIPAAIVNNQLQYHLGFLTPGDYSVSIFSYDIATHQAVYFGEYDGTVTVTASGSGQHTTGIDFNADTSLL
jgi:hypothetical protein